MCVSVYLLSLPKLTDNRGPESERVKGQPKLGTWERAGEAIVRL